METRETRDRLLSKHGSPCRYCGTRVLWIVDAETGKRLPLDPVPPVFQVEPAEREVKLDDGTVTTVLCASRRTLGMVLHHATCRPYQERQRRRNVEKRGRP